MCFRIECFKILKNILKWEVPRSCSGGHLNLFPRTCFELEWRLMCQNFTPSRQVLDTWPIDWLILLIGEFESRGRLWKKCLDTGQQFERMLHRKRGNNNKNIPKSSASSESISHSIKNKRDVTHGTCSFANDNSTLEKLDVRGDDGSADSSDVSSRIEYVLTGLHACGDLTPTLLRLFAESNDCVGVAAVGCCYMRMKARLDLVNLE